MVFSQQQRGAHPLTNQVCSFCPCGCIWWVLHCLPEFAHLYKLWETVKDRGVWLAACSPWSHRVGCGLAAEQQQLADLSKYTGPSHLGYRRRTPLCHSKASGGADLSQGPCVERHLPSVLKMQTGWCGLRTQWRYTQWSLLTTVF